MPAASRELTAWLKGKGYTFNVYHVYRGEAAAVLQPWGTPDNLVLDARGACGPLTRSEDEQGDLAVVREPHDLRVLAAEECCDVGGPAVPETQPEDLGRMTAQEAPLPEVVVFGDDDEPAHGSTLPDRFVVSATQSQLAYVT